MVLENTLYFFSVYVVCDNPFLSQNLNLIDIYALRRLFYSQLMLEENRLNVTNIYNMEMVSKAKMTKVGILI